MLNLARATIVTIHTLLAVVVVAFFSAFAEISKATQHFNIMRYSFRGLYILCINRLRCRLRVAVHKKVGGFCVVLCDMMCVSSVSTVPLICMMHNCKKYFFFSRCVHELVCLCVCSVQCKCHTMSKTCILFFEFMLLLFFSSCAVLCCAVLCCVALCCVANQKQREINEIKKKEELHNIDKIVNIFKFVCICVCVCECATKTIIATPV